MTEEVVEAATFLGADVGLDGTVLGVNEKEDEAVPSPKNVVALTL